MNDKIVRIGTEYARIRRITSAQLDYALEDGRLEAINLDDCTKNWVQLFEKERGNIVILTSEDEVRAWNSACVGMRDALAERPWVRFMTNPPIRLEFDDRDALYSELLDPLMAVGKHTFDST
jgi:hypothetical protein